jgi:hypothetical protein
MLSKPEVSASQSATSRGGSKINREEVAPQIGCAPIPGKRRRVRWQQTTGPDESLLSAIIFSTRSASSREISAFLICCGLTRERILPEQRHRFIGRYHVRKQAFALQQAVQMSSRSFRWRSSCVRSSPFPVPTSVVAFSGTFSACSRCSSSMSCP